MMVSDAQQLLRRLRTSAGWPFAAGPANSGAILPVKRVVPVPGAKHQSYKPRRGRESGSNINRVELEETIGLLIHVMPRLGIRRVDPGLRVQDLGEGRGCMECQPMVCVRCYFAIERLIVEIANAVPAYLGLIDGDGPKLWIRQGQILLCRRGALQTRGSRHVASHRVRDLSIQNRVNSCPWA